MKSKKGNPKQTAFTVENTAPSDWADSQRLMELFPISRRSLQYYRRCRIIPYGKLGGKVFYYVPGVLKVLEATASR